MKHNNIYYKLTGTATKETCELRLLRLRVEKISTGLFNLYARYLCSRDALGLAALALGLAAARPSARATIGYLVYNFSTKKQPRARASLSSNHLLRLNCSRDNDKWWISSSCKDLCDYVSLVLETPPVPPMNSIPSSLFSTAAKSAVSRRIHRGLL